jgi:hypothetical protein
LAAFLIVAFSDALISPNRAFALLEIATRSTVR